MIDKCGDCSKIVVKNWAHFDYGNNFQFMCTTLILKQEKGKSVYVNKKTFFR